MGATPQSGVFHNNRVGDFDPFCLPYLMERTHRSLEEILKALSTQSGFLGLSGISSDLRDIEEACEAGDRRAELTIQAFTDSVAGYVGQYTVYLKGIDALVFTGGIGCNSRLIRARICQRLAHMGIAIGDDTDTDHDREISRPESRIRVWVLQTDEERIIARHTRPWLEA